jgi:hypothetical protein
LAYGPIESYNCLSVRGEQTNDEQEHPMTKTFHGTVHGQFIQIEETLDIADGEEVVVIVRRTKTLPASGDGIRRSAGAAASMPGFDDVFAQIELERKAARYREPGE